MDPVLRPFVRVNDGRRGVGFFFSIIKGERSSDDRGADVGGESIDDSVGLSSGVGDCNCNWMSNVPYGTLWGRGDMSMSIPSTMPGEEATGGVVAKPGRFSNASGSGTDLLTLIASLKDVAGEQCTTWSRRDVRTRSDQS